jgi:hypothetical protein
MNLRTRLNILFDDVQKLIVGAILILLIVVLPTSIVINNKSNNKQTHNPIQVFVDGRIKIVKIDNCEYILISQSPLNIIHKANCTNHFHTK